MMQRMLISLPLVFRRAVVGIVLFAAIPMSSRVAVAQTTAVVYVDKVGGSVSPTGAGDAWGNDHAYKYLQDALVRAGVLLGSFSDVQIWVAGVDDEDGNVYHPNEGNGLSSTDRSLTFSLRNDVSILCGFEAGVHEEANERDWRKYKVTLSGDIDDEGFDDSYHVLTADRVDESAIIDGATVTGGYADGTDENSGGGGLLILGYREHRTRPPR